VIIGKKKSAISIEIADFSVQKYRNSINFAN
jgi:hypothetical protein